MKEQYLGLVKPKKTNRYTEQYKSKLLFEWDKTEDTSGGVLNSFGRDSLKKI